MDNNKTPGISVSIMSSILMGLLGVFTGAFGGLVDRIAAQLGLDASGIGAALATFAAGTLVSVLIGGAIAERIGKRKVIIGSLCVLIAGLLIAANGAVRWLTVLGIFMVGIGHGPSESMGSAMLTSLNPEHETRWMNISQIMFCVGAVTAPIIAVWYCLKTGNAYGHVFIGMAVLFALIGVYYCFLKYDGGGEKNDPGAKRIPLAHVLKSPLFRLYALMLFIYMSYESVGPAYIKLMLLQSGAAEQYAAIGISLFWVSMIGGRFIGVFLDKKELKGVLLFTPFVCIGCLLLLFVPDVNIKLLGAVCYGFGCGPVWPMMFALASRVFPRNSAAACSVLMVFSSLGNSLCPLLIGAWVGNVRITFTITIFTSLAMTAIAFYMNRREHAPNASNAA